MFKEGYVRTSSAKFTLDTNSISKPEIHLTNNAVQKKLENYGKYEQGNILSFD
jgi:tubulin--tyrosine ligase